MPTDPEKLSLAARARALEAVGEVGRVLAAELELSKLIQAITDASTRFTEAQFGAFFYNVLNADGESYSLYTLSGVPREAFDKFPMPRNTSLFGPTFRGEGPVRIADVTQDPRYGNNHPHHGMPAGHLPVRSYLAAPVISRNGEVIGGLFFGHPEPDRFTADHEEVLVGITRFAAVAVDNARLREKARGGEIANAHLAAIVQSSDDAIISKDLDGVVRSWNAGAERTFGYTAAEIVGKSISILIPPERPEEEAQILSRLRRGERIDHFETIRVRKDGRRIHVSVTTSPVRDPQGRIVGASKVVRDITDRVFVESEREQLLAAERAARAEAEHHGRLKDEFLATLGHELRTPLNAVLGWAQLLQRPDVSEDDLAKGLEVIERNARQQAQLIDDLLDMSRIVSGKLRVTVQPVDLESVIRAAIESVRPAVDAKQITIEEEFEPGAELVSGDSNRLQQVMWNLLTNAVKFTPRQGRIRVLLERDDACMHASIIDSGEGIAAEFLPMVFDRFRQADASTTRRHGGLGLGLAIVKQLVELHGGVVKALSDGPGRGSTFVVSLPIRRTDPGVLRGQAAGSPSRTPAGEISLSGLRIVVVDDESDARNLVRRLLEEAGAQVIAVATAQEAFDAITSQPPHILLTDIGMPDEDGYSLIRRIRALPRSQGGATPAVALTAFARAEDRRRSLLSGFQMHLAKPVEAIELIAVIASVTRRL